MKKLLYLLSVILLTACGGNTESNLPEGLEYSIIDENQNEHFKKTNINIRIDKKIDEETLKTIAEELKAERDGFENLWIFYYLPDMKVGSGAWATTHFSPDLDVQILGSTEKEDKQIQNSSDVSGEIIGKWKSDKSLMGAVLILYKNDDSKIMMRINWKSGNPSDDEITESQEKGLTKYDDGNGHGEYYILEKNGNLGMYGKDGKFDEAIKIN